MEEFNRHPGLKSRTARESIVAPLDLDFVDCALIRSESIGRMLMADRHSLELCRMELSRLDNHSLYIRRRHVKYYYYKSGDRKHGETSIISDPPKIDELARRKYLERQIEQLEVNCKRLTAAVSIYDYQRNKVGKRKTLEKQQESGYDLTKLLFTDEQNRWIDSPYTPNPYHQENLRFKTKGGIYMRSKSEAFIGSAIEDKGLPYRSDDIVRISGIDFSDPSAIYEKTYFADFKIPNLRGGISVNEHFGAFNIRGYSENAITRINDYRRYHLFRREEIFWTLDSDIEDPEILDQIIKNMLLPY